MKAMETLVRWRSSAVSCSMRCDLRAYRRAIWFSGYFVLSRRSIARVSATDHAGIAGRACGNSNGRSTDFHVIGLGQELLSHLRKFPRLATKHVRLLPHVAGGELNEVRRSFCAGKLREVLVGGVGVRNRELQDLGVVVLGCLQGISDQIGSPLGRSSHLRSRALSHRRGFFPRFSHSARIGHVTHPIQSLKNVFP